MQVVCEYEDRDASHGEKHKEYFVSRDWISYPLLLLIFLYMKVNIIINSMRLRLEALEYMMYDKAHQLEDIFYILQCVIDQMRPMVFGTFFSFSEELFSKTCALLVGIQELIRKMAIKYIMGHFKVVQCIAPKSASSLVEDKLEALFAEKQPVKNTTAEAFAKFSKMKRNLFDRPGQLKVQHDNFTILPQQMAALSPTASIGSYIDDAEQWSWMLFLFFAMIILIFTFLRKKRSSMKKTNRGSNSILQKTISYASHGPSWLFLISGMVSFALAMTESYILKMAALQLMEAVASGSKGIILALSKDMSTLLRLEFSHLETAFRELYEISKSYAIQPMIIISPLQDLLAEVINGHLIPTFNEIFDSGMASWATNVLLPIASVLKCISGMDSDALKAAFLSPLQSISQALIFPLPTMIKEAQDLSTPLEIEKMLLHIVNKTISHEFMVRTAITSDEYLLCLILILAGLFVIVVQSSCYALFLLWKKRQQSTSRVGLF